MAYRWPEGQAEDSRRGKPPWTRVAAVALVIGACAMIALLGAGATAVWVKARPMAQATRTPTTTSRPMQTRTAAPTHTAAPTRKAAPTRTPSPVPRPSATVAPDMATPWVCTDLDQVGQIKLAPGQRFGCTFREEQFTAKLAEVPDLPCSSARVILADGEISLRCYVLFEVRVSGVVKTDGCQLSLEITQGPAGFVDAVQDRIDQEMQRMAGESVCIDQIAIGDGEITIGGYGK